MWGKPVPMKIFITWPKPPSGPSELVTAHLQATLQWSLLKPYKGFITCNTMGHNKPCAQTMC